MKDVRAATHLRTTPSYGPGGGRARRPCILGTVPEGRVETTRCNLCCCLGIEEADIPTQAFDACRPIGGLTGSFWDRAGNRAGWSALLLLTAARDLLVRPRSAVGPPCFGR